MCFEGKWLRNRLQADKNESRSLSAVDIQRHQRGGFCIFPIVYTDVMLDNFRILLFLADTPGSAKTEKPKRRRLLSKNVGLCAESPQVSHIFSSIRQS